MQGPESKFRALHFLPGSLREGNNRETAPYRLASGQAASNDREEAPVTADQPKQVIEQKPVRKPGSLA